MYKLDVLSHLTDDEYMALNDMVKTCKIDIDPEAYKKICEDMYEHVKATNGDMPVHLLAAMSGDAYCLLYVPTAEPLPTEVQRPYGDKMQAAVKDIMQAYWIPHFCLTDANTGNLYCAVVLDRNDCEKHGITFHDNGDGHGLFGDYSNSSIKFPVNIMPFSDAEKKRYFEELIDREIEVYGPEAVGVTPERAEQRKREREQREASMKKKKGFDFWNR